MADLDKSMGYDRSDRDSGPPRKLFSLSVTGGGSSGSERTVADDATGAGMKQKL